MASAPKGLAAATRLVLGLAAVFVVAASAPAHAGPIRTFNLQNSFPQRATLPRGLSARLPSVHKPKEIVVVGSKIKEPAPAGTQKQSMTGVSDYNISEILAGNGDAAAGGEPGVQAGDVLLHRWQK
jgi:hypothetical protein